MSDPLASLFCESRSPVLWEVRQMPRTQSGKTSAGKPKSPRCKTCGRAIRVPEGWSFGAAVRRHYWRKHRDVMTRRAGEAQDG